MTTRIRHFAARTGVKLSKARARIAVGLAIRS